jgi:hypothetical protein
VVDGTASGLRTYTSTPVTVSEMVRSQSGCGPCSTAGWIAAGFIGAFGDRVMLHRDKAIWPKLFVQIADVFHMNLHCNAAET